MSGEIMLKKYSGEVLKKLRVERCMTQQMLAFELTKFRKERDGAIITRQTISKYENGDRGMNLETISDLAELLHVPVSCFFPNSETLQDTIGKQTTNFYSKTIVDEDGFSLEIKTAIPFDNLDLETQKEMMDASMEELLAFKKRIRKTQT